MSFLIAAALVVGALPLAIGCALLAVSDEIELMLPQIPPEWLEAWGECGFLVVAGRGSGERTSVLVPPGTRSIVVRTDRESVTAVVAFPVWTPGGPLLPAGEHLRPAGAVIGRGGRAESSAGPPDGGSRRLRFEEGFGAFALLCVSDRGLPLTFFNAERLLREIRERLPEDPWVADIERIVRSLCERSMRADYLKPAATHDVLLTIPDGRWLARSPFADPLTGGAQVVALPGGVSDLFDGLGRRLVVSVDEEGRGWLALQATTRPD